MIKPPLRPDDLERVFRAASEDDHLIVIGGQSLAVWAAALGFKELPTSADVDFQGNVNDARHLQAALQYPLELMHTNDRTTLVGVLTFHDAAGESRQVDVLRSPAGLRAEDVDRNALKLPLPSGGTLRVLHPNDCVISKLTNLSLPNKQESSDFLQAELSLQIAKGYWSRRLADPPSPKRAAREYRHHALRLHDFALSNYGKHAFKHHGHDAFDVVRPHPQCDPDFRERLYPRLRTEVNELQAKIAPNAHAVQVFLRSPKGRTVPMRTARLADYGQTFSFEEQIEAAVPLLVLRSPDGIRICCAAPSRSFVNNLEPDSPVELSRSGRVRAPSARGIERG